MNRQCLLVVIVTSLACLASAQTEKSLQPSLRGKVARFDTQEPVQGAAVTLLSKMNTAVTATAVTDKDGVFSFGRVPEGTYTVQASKAGFVRSELSGGPQNLTFFAGATIKDIHLQLAPAGVISGRVLDESGNPRKSAEVSAVRLEYDRGRLTLNPCRVSEGLRAIVNEEGRFRLYDLSPGDYYLVASVRGHCTGSGTYFYPGVTDPADAVRFVVRPGQEVGGIDFKTPPATEYSAQIRIPSASGSSGDESRAAVLDILLRGRSNIDVPYMSLRSMNSDLVKNLADDMYVIDGLAAGTYDIYASTDRRGARVWRAQGVVVNDGASPLTLEFSRQVTVSGQILAPEDVRLAPLQVRFVPLDGPLYILNHMTAKVDPNGAFELQLARRQYRIEVQGLPEPYYLSTAQYGARDVLAGIDLENTSDGVLNLAIAAPAGIVEGTVQTAKGDFASDSHVVLIPAINLRGNGALYKTAETDQFGVFSISGVAPGEYSAFAWDAVDPGAPENPAFLRQFETRGARITVRAGLNPVSLRITPSSNN